MVLIHEDHPRIKLISDGRPWTSKLIVIDDEGREIDISKFIVSVKWELGPGESPVMTVGICGRYVDVDLMSILKDCTVTILGEK